MPWTTGAGRVTAVSSTETGEPPVELVLVDGVDVLEPAMLDDVDVLDGIVLLRIVEFDSTELELLELLLDELELDELDELLLLDDEELLEDELDCTQFGTCPYV